MPAQAQAETDSGIMGMITGMFSGVGSMFAGGSMTMIIGGAVGVLVLILLVVILMRRRKGVNFQESILNGGGAEAEAAAVDATPSQDSSMMGGESSFLSDFAISGVSAIQAEDSEVDPLTEADVFMAYGRYEAAEERLQEAISQDPGRGELRVKLLELYNTTKNKQGFESAAEEFYASLGDNAAANPLWQKVVAMGSEIAPGNPLFSGEGMPTLNTDAMESPEPAANLGSDDVMDIGLDTGVFSNSELTGGESTSATEQAAEAYTGGDDLDFSLDADTGAQPTAAGEASAGGDLDFSLDSDEGGAELEMPGEEDLSFDLNTGDESTQTALSSDEAGLDFGLDADSSATGDDDLEFNLDLGGGDEETATDIKLDMADSASAETSSGGLDFDLNTEDDTSGDTEPGMDMNLDAGDAIDLEMAAGGDEVGTKLDLARAYIDMGDPDGARSILDEVIDEGDDGQKQEAQQLMSQIG
jgi:pilus assembly protein FimV